MPGCTRERNPGLRSGASGSLIATSRTSSSFRTSVLFDPDTSKRRPTIQELPCSARPFLLRYRRAPLGGRRCRCVMRARTCMRMRSISGETIRLRYRPTNKHNAGPAEEFGRDQRRRGDGVDAAHGNNHTARPDARDVGSGSSGALCSTQRFREDRIPFQSRKERAEHTSDRSIWPGALLELPEKGARHQGQFLSETARITAWDRDRLLGSNRIPTTR